MIIGATALFLCPKTTWFYPKKKQDIGHKKSPLELTKRTFFMLVKFAETNLVSDRTIPSSCYRQVLCLL
jgi:hypothetical protein